MDALLSVIFTGLDSVLVIQTYIDKNMWSLPMTAHCGSRLCMHVKYIKYPSDSRCVASGPSSSCRENILFNC